MRIDVVKGSIFTIVNTQMWKGIGNTATLIFSLNRRMKYMMVLPEVKDSGVIDPRSDLWVGTTSRRITSMEIN